MLTVSGINVSYSESKIIKGVDLRIDQDEIVCIIGGNAAGKSTIIKTISGLIHPDSGAIEFLGKRIERLPPHEIVELGISQVPEGRRIFAKMTVRENLELASLTRKSKVRMKQNMAAVHNIFPILEDRANQSAGSLSGGEQQMLAIGMSLMSLPRLLLLDEPGAGLSPLLVINLFEIIKNEIHKKGVTVFLAEQHVKMSLELSDRGYVIENGRIILEGSGKGLLENQDIRQAYLGV